MDGFWRNFWFSLGRVGAAVFKNSFFERVVQPFVSADFKHDQFYSESTVDPDGTKFLVIGMRDFKFNVEVFNQQAAEYNLPIVIVDASCKDLRFKLKQSIECCVIESDSLKITAQVKQRQECATSMLSSMMASMAGSLHGSMKEFAKESGFEQPPENKTFDGVQSVATNINSFLNSIQINLLNTYIQLEYFPEDSPSGVGLLFKINLISYKDATNNSPTPDDANEEEDESKGDSFATSYNRRSCRLEGVTLSSVEFVRADGADFNQTEEDDSTNEDIFLSQSDNSADEEEEDIPSARYAEPVKEYSRYESSETRHIIECGRFQSKIEVIVGIKRSEGLAGPNMAIEINMGSLVLFLSPRQLHQILELTSGFVNSNLENKSKSIEAKYGGKKMTMEDYQCLEKDLQDQLDPCHNLQTNRLNDAYGWSTATFGEDLEDDFVSMDNTLRRGGLYGSDASINSFETSITSAMSTCTEKTSRTQKIFNRIETDPTAEQTHINVNLTSVAVVLLQEDLLTSSLDDGANLVLSSVQQMQNVANSFFSEIHCFYLAGKDFAEIDRVLDNNIKMSHIRLRAAPVEFECDERTAASGVTVIGYFEADTFELHECLYDTEKKVLEHVPLLTFSENANCFATPVQRTNPSFRLSLKHSKKSSRSTKKSNKAKTDLLISLEKCNLELDITLVDRITALLNPPHICIVKEVPKPWSYVEPEENKSSLSMKIASVEVNARLRFPQPDFRPAHDSNRTPWWKRHVRPDYLNLVLTDTSFQTTFKSEGCSVECRTMDVTYFENSSSAPEHIAKAGMDNKMEDSLSDMLCRFNIKTLKERPILPNYFNLANKMNSSVAGSIFSELSETKNGPFCSKKIMRVSDTPHDKDQAADRKELKIPGDKEDIKTFVTDTEASSKLHLEIFLPTLSLQFLSKHLYELIYNRINKDILLWEPSAPKPSRPSVPKYSDMDVRIGGSDKNFIYKTEIYQDYGSDSSEETEENTNVFYSAYSTAKSSHSPKETAVEDVQEEVEDQSEFTVSLRIGQSIITLYTPARDSYSNVIPGQHGEFFVNVEGAHLFMVSGYMGDPDLTYLSLQIRNSQLYHCDIAPNPRISPPLKEVGTSPGNHLFATVYKSEKGMLVDNRNRGENREMVTLAIKVQKSCETHPVKDIIISAGFNKVTLKHRMVQSPNSWISQLIDFFKVADHPIPGYDVKEIVTEMHVSFWDSAIDYRPKYLPLRSAITLGTFSISSHLSVDVNSSVLRFIAEDCGLSISKKGVPVKNVPYYGPAELRRDYVNVIDLDIFEISLKTSDKKTSLNPHFDLRASNNYINVHTCADTCQALTQLVQYFAGDGDLVPQDDQSGGAGSAFSSPHHHSRHFGEELVCVTPTPQEKPAALSERSKKIIGEMLNDALQEETDDRANKRNRGRQSSYTVNGVKVFYFPDENQVMEDSGSPLSQVTAELGEVRLHSVPASDSGELEFDEDFFFVERELLVDARPKHEKPESEWSTSRGVLSVGEKFGSSAEKTDPFKVPETFGNPTTKYNLYDMTIVWHMYGGNDFSKQKSQKTSRRTVNFADRRNEEHASVGYSKPSTSQVTIETGNETPKRSWLQAGGRSRNHDLHMQVKLSKVRYLYEVYPDSSDKASRQVLLISDVEVKDKLCHSEINKFLCQDCSASNPKKTNANMVAIRSVMVRPDPQLPREECCLKISIQPLRLHIDQDALFFFVQFFEDLQESGGDDIASEGNASKQGTPVHHLPIMTVNEDSEAMDPEQNEALKNQDKKDLLLLEEHFGTEDDTKSEDDVSVTIAGESGPIYFKSIIFSPALPIKFDYGSKRVDMKYGSLSGILLGLTNLKDCEVKLKSVNYKHGILGVDRLIQFLLQEWGKDIKRNQMSGIVSGFAPVHIMVQLYQGLRDLFWMPIEQYKKDGRILRGVYRGANSFTKSTAGAFLDLTFRLINLIQYTAESAFDMVTPGPTARYGRRQGQKKKKRYRRPQNAREGLHNAIELVKEAYRETKGNVIQGATAELEEKGYCGAVGAVMRQIPSTVIKPIITTTQATNNLLGGLRCELVPDARREVRDKWRNEDESM